MTKPMEKREEILKGFPLLELLNEHKKGFIYKAMQNYSDLKLSTLEERIEGMKKKGKLIPLDFEAMIYKEITEAENKVLDQVLTEIKNLKDGK